MERTERFEKPSLQRVLIGGATLAATQLSAAWISRQRPIGDAAAFEAALVVAIGLFAVGALYLRHTPYPRWAYATMVAILGAAILISPLTAVSPEAWLEQRRDSLWMFPWFLMFLVTLPPSQRGVCAPDSPRVGWLMIGTALVLGGLIQITTRIRPF